MIILLTGGTSAEREVSLWTGASMAEALTILHQTYIEIDASDPHWLEQVKAHAPELVMIALHGPFGEDGTVQALLEQNEMLFTGSGSSVSALAIDKAVTKELVAKIGVQVPSSIRVATGNEVIWDGLFPVVVKPNGDGSSFGVSIVEKQDDLGVAVEKALHYGSQILIEEYIAGVEVSCGVTHLEGLLHALPVIEIRPRGEFFDFDSKYAESGALEICPAQIGEDQTMLVQSLSVKIFELLGCKQYARVDWIIREGVPYFLEINTLPGMTKNSLLPKELVADGSSYKAFIHKLIKDLKK